MMVPSIWWEPLGLVVYEAYDFAKPVLAACSGGLIETVLGGETGLLHSPGCVDEMVRDVLAMEEMPAAQRSAMGAAGREWLLRETKVTAWQDRFDAIIERAWR
jgi:glycosyltransferase involved in cell wall biosynthesis